MNKKILFFILSVMVFAVCYPVIFLLTGSFMGNEELMEYISPVLSTTGEGFAKWTLLPDKFSIESYKELVLYQPGFFVLFWNSVKICIGVLAGQFLVSVPAAWAFARYRTKGIKLLFGLYVTFMLMPFQVLMLSEYLVFSKMNLLNTLGAIILPGIFATFPVFIIYNYFRSIPESVIEAGRTDGAGEFQIMMHIGIPAGLPGIAAAMILQFLEYWNIIEQPMIFLDSSEKWPLSLYLPNIDLTNAGIAMAASVITLLPSYLIFRLGQEYLEGGISSLSAKN